MQCAGSAAPNLSGAARSALRSLPYRPPAPPVQLRIPASALRILRMQFFVRQVRGM